MKTIPASIFFIIFLIATIACNQPAKSDTQGDGHAQQTALKSDPFKDFWYQGKAELTSYQLEQARYGEIHKGEAVLIFVTEDFSKSKQVKLDNPQQAGSDAVNVLKLNFTKKFNTGIYPYSIMQSTFTPVDYKQYPHSLKVSTSSQEWCGHTFMQLNLKGNNYKVSQNSYFESEGDKNFEVPADLLEDEVWARIRIAPSSLPTGQLRILPGTVFTRLRHTDFKPVEATASLTQSVDNKDVMTYELKYPVLERTLSIHFKKAFPHEITGWEESSFSGFGENAKLLITKATKKKSLMLDYWNKHNVADAEWRGKLGLEE